MTFYGSSEGIVVRQQNYYNLYKTFIRLHSPSFTFVHLYKPVLLYPKKPDTNLNDSSFIQMPNSYLYPLLNPDSVNPNANTNLNLIHQTHLFILFLTLNLTLWSS